MERPTTSEVRAPSKGILSGDQVRETLRAVALFQGLEGSDLDRILEISESILVESGECVFEEGDRGDHFFVIVRGQIELRKRWPDGFRRLAVLRAGQAFGEMALLNQTPRSASAHALEDTCLLSVSRAAFAQILGGETLAVRLLRNLSRALWATSVRLAAQQAHFVRQESPQATLADFNRLLRSRLLPRVTPRLDGYDLSAATLAPRQGTGSSAWDWFLFHDERLVVAVMRAVRADVFSAQRLATLRTVLRSLSDEPQPSLGVLLAKANRDLRSSWVEGLSGPVACVLVALGQDGAEIASAGYASALLLRAGGATEELGHGAPALGERAGHAYESKPVALGNRDKVILLSQAPPGVARLVTSVVTEGYTSSSRDALNKLFARFQGGDGARGGCDLSGAVITRTRTS
jgi:CRP-like cAMP-binding protein